MNALSTKDLRNLFKLRQDTPSDTHDKLRCERCQTISDDAELEGKKVLPKKLAACRGLLDRMMEQQDSSFFTKPLVAQDHGVSKEEYENKVKQPMDLGTIGSRLDLPPDKPSAYESVSGFSKDVNRIFANVLKVWTPGQDIADAARRLQAWWVDEWTNIVPILMSMKSDDDSASPQDPGGLEEASGGNADNERGDNFQEQIGMPDEEDMRCWSHHHTPDTVDDPVFRAAMRGFDSVSFVFGLEVTWSLIQQRKQEEEEKQAMLELEEAQRCNPAKEGDEDDSLSDEADEEMTTAISPEKDDDHGGDRDDSPDEMANADIFEPAEVVEDPNDDSDGSSEDMEIAAGGRDDSPDEMANAEIGGPAEVVKDPNDHSDGNSECMEIADDCESEIVEDCPDTRVEALETPPDSYKLTESPGVEANHGAALGTETDESPGPDGNREGGLDSDTDDSTTGVPAIANLVPNDKWLCHACTFSNAATRKTCGMCRKKRDPPVPSQKWLCQSCTFSNAATKKTCGMCRTKKEPPKKKRRVIDDDE